VAPFKAMFSEARIIFDSTFWFLRRRVMYDMVGVSRI